MILPVCEFVLLAQEEAADPNSFMRLMFPLVAIMVLFYFLLIRPQKNKENQTKQMISALKENDRVVTIGGIHGVVTNVQRDADRVTIRVDEATGAKIRISMSAIGHVVTDDDQGDSGKTGG